MQGKYNFIKFQKIILRNFSLYKKKEKIYEVNEDINEGVYCLAGANGLGKSTFLNAINYGLTGIVLQPNNEVYEPEDIETFNKDYSLKYFQGRIDSKQKDKAEIELLISVNNKFIRIIRGFNSREELRLLEVFELKNKKKVSLFNTAKLSPKELLKKYETLVTDEVGIGKFEYFIFFQLYVLTFDENRRTLFWQEKAANNAFTIAFNDDIKNTEKSLSLKKEMDELESYGRNSRWQATQIKNEIEKLISTNKQKKDNKNYTTLRKEFNKLHSDVESFEDLYSDVNTEYDTLLKRQNLLNSEILHLKIEYKKLFALYSEPRSKLLHSPYIKLAKKENTCFICGSKGHHVVEHMEKKLHLSSCPMCDTPVNNDKNKEQDGLLKKVKDVDKKISNRADELESLIMESDVKKVELDRSAIQFNNAKKELSKFEKENSKISFDKTGEAPIDTLIEEYQKQFDKLDKKALDYYAKRDKLSPLYDNLLKKVDAGYRDAEKMFVPLFKKLAESFIGLDLKIHPKRKGRNFTLYLEMKESPRTKSHQLSESQRFFLDIALRMALLVYLSRKNNEATMIIDTPEGSLDIAYEYRVGQMFAEYIKDFKQNIIMTANINASQLLVSLADKCREENMQFKRMLNWTDLSEIQKGGEHLFNQVYESIDKKLRGIKK